MKPQQQVSVRGRALQNYYDQRPRPAGEVLEKINGVVRKAMTPHRQAEPAWVVRTQAYLFGDLIRRNRLTAANELLHAYQDSPFNLKPKFEAALKECVEKHGPISLKPDALRPEACYPSFNCVPGFRVKHPDFFK